MHTPGPWTIQTPFAPDTISIVVGGPEAFDWKFVAEVISEKSGISKKQAKANAALIASAPDLLGAAVALEDAEAYHANCLECEGELIPEACPACFPHFDKARLLRRAAIARATGAA